jgi:hypothetical protein
MKKVLIVTMLFALAQMEGRASASSPVSPRADLAAEIMGGGAAGAMHGRGMASGGGFRGGEMRGGEVRGDRRGVAPGGEIRERGEHRGFREHHHRGHHRGFGEGGILIYPGPYYYPSYPDYDFDTPEYGPPDQPAYLYYCENPAGYFPNVVQCPEGWEEIPTGE